MTVKQIAENTPKGSRRNRPFYIDSDIWEFLKGKSFVEIADYVDDLTEAYNGSKAHIAALLAENRRLRRQ